MLNVSNVETGYIKKQVIFNISINVNSGDIVSLVGPNGSGKSTLLKVILGVIPLWKGNIFFNACDIRNEKTHIIISKGIGYIPQQDKTFNELTVLENMEIGGYLLNKQETNRRSEDIFVLFPILKDRKKQIAGKLSGGEKQLLALGRCLMTRPKLVLMDEPSIGLSPNLVLSLFNYINYINKKDGISFLIVEQKLKNILSISNKLYVLRQGKIVFETEGKGLQHLKTDNIRKYFI